MKASPITELVSVKLEMSGDEAGQLYSELYRLSVDIVGSPYPAEGLIAALMRELSKVGADE